MGLIILTNLRLVLLIETFATQTHTDIFHSQASILQSKSMHGTMAAECIRVWCGLRGYIYHGHYTESPEPPNHNIQIFHVIFPPYEEWTGQNAERT